LFEATHLEKLMAAETLAKRRRSNNSRRIIVRRKQLKNQGKQIEFLEGEGTKKPLLPFVQVAFNAIVKSASTSWVRTHSTTLATTVLLWCWHTEVMLIFCCAQKHDDNEEQRRHEGRGAQWQRGGQ
jgi:hypothetical protein